MKKSPFRADCFSSVNYLSNPSPCGSFMKAIASIHGPCGVTWDSSRTVLVIKLRRTSALSLQGSFRSSLSAYVSCNAMICVLVYACACITLCVRVTHCAQTVTDTEATLHIHWSKFSLASTMHINFAHALLLALITLSAVTTTYGKSSVVCPRTFIRN